MLSRVSVRMRREQRYEEPGVRVGQEFRWVVLTQPQSARSSAAPDKALTKHVACSGSGILSTDF